MKLLNYSIITLLWLTNIAFTEEYTTIDAFTSSSTRLKINSGKVYPTYAEIEWWDYYSNGEVHELKWGKTSTYEHTMDLKGFTRQTNITSKINELEPNTKYYAEFHRTYPSKGKDISTKFEFTTPESATSISLRPQVTTTPNLTDGTHIALFSIAGQKVAVKATNRHCTVSTLFAHTVVPGLYLARVLDIHGRVLYSYQCVVEK